MRKVFICSVSILLLSMFLFSSCDGGGGSNSPVRFQMISIPGFEEEDYLKQLNDPSEEIKVNALLNLISSAKDYGNTLNLLTQDPDDEDFKPLTTEQLDKIANTEKKLDTIFAFEFSRNPHLQSALFMFLGAYGSALTGDTRVLTTLYESKPLSTNSRFEKLSAISRCSISSEVLPEKLVLQNAKHSSWRVRSKLFDLLSETDSRPYHPFLLKAYEKNRRSFDQRLILNAFDSKLSESDILFFQKDFFKAAEVNRSKILKMLLKCRQDEKIFAWLKASDFKMKEDDFITINSHFRSNLDSLASIDWYTYYLIEVSHLPLAINLSSFIEDLYSELDNEELENREILENFEKEFVKKADYQANIKDYWDLDRADRVAKESEDEFDNLFLQKYLLLLETHLQKTDQLLNSMGASEDIQDAYLESIEEFLDLTGVYE